MNKHVNLQEANTEQEKAISSQKQVIENLKEDIKNAKHNIDKLRTLSDGQMELLQKFEEGISLKAETIKVL